MQNSSPLMHVLTADLHTRVLCLLDIGQPYLKSPLYSDRAYQIYQGNDF